MALHPILAKRRNLIDGRPICEERNSVPILHGRDDIFSARHAPSWLMLSFAAGCVNAIAAAACDRYVTHVTGTVTRLGMEIARLEILFDFTLVLASFIGGAMLSGLLINGRAYRNKKPYYSLPLLITAALTAMCALLGDRGFLAPFGTVVDQPGDFIFLSILSFASGLQNAAVGTSTGQLVRTTHLTGPATDLGIHLVEVFFMRGKRRQAAYQHAMLRAGKIFSFAFGAGVGIILVHQHQFLALMVPSAIIVLATCVSFVDDGSDKFDPQRSENEEKRASPS